MVCRGGRGKVMVDALSMKSQAVYNPAIKSHAQSIH